MTFCGAARHASRLVVRIRAEALPRVDAVRLMYAMHDVKQVQFNSMLT